MEEEEVEAVEAAVAVVAEACVEEEEEFTEIRSIQFKAGNYQKFPLTIGISKKRVLVSRMQLYHTFNHFVYTIYVQNIPATWKHFYLCGNCIQINGENFN